MDDATAAAMNTTNGYSYDRYGAAGWLACAQLLTERGCTQPETEAFLLSKHMRWAGDLAEDLDLEPGRDGLAAYLDRQMPDRSQLLAEARNLMETS